MNTDNSLITQLTDISEDKCGSGEWCGLSSRELTYEEWKELIFEKPHYSYDENIQKKFEFAVKMTGIGKVLEAMCKEFNDESLKRFIEKYFEDNKLLTDYYEQVS